jgi:predicted transcriptional regulator
VLLELTPATDPLIAACVSILSSAHRNSSEYYGRNAIAEEIDAHSFQVDALDTDEGTSAEF